MEKEKKEKLQIEYYDAKAGWINIRLKSCDKMYEERFSHVFDPLPDLKCWLEAIVIGVEQTSFTFDNEGNVIKFDVQRKWINCETEYLFTITWEDENRVVFQVLVDKKQMIDAFYSSLVNFYNSDKYNPKEWEFSITHNKLCNLLNLDYSQLIDYCAKLSKQKLIELLNEIEADEAVWWVEEDYLTDYFNKSFEDKKEDMKVLLNNNANPYNGMSLSDFRSKIIENYLNEN